MGVVRRCLSFRSPGKIIIDWIVATISGWIPRNLFTPSELILLTLGFLVFVVLCISLFLPIYLANDTVALGYLGTIPPIIYVIFLGQYTQVRIIHRMASTNAFDSGLFEFERWSKQADTAWLKVATAFKETKLRERATNGVDRNQNRILRTQIPYNEYAKTVQVLLRADEVVDLPVKLKRAVDGYPKTYFEKKLINVIFPQTREERRERNKHKIVYLPILRMWVWKRSLLVIAAFLLLFLLPPAILIPVSYKDGSLPPQPPTSQPVSRLLFDSSVESFPRNLQDQPSPSAQMYLSTYYALYVISLLLPFTYLCLLGFEVSWQLLRLVFALVDRCCGRNKDRIDQADPLHIVENGAKPVVRKATKKIVDPRKRNVDVAKSDIEDSLQYLSDRWQFSFEPFFTEDKRINTSSGSGHRDMQNDTERNASVDATLKALEDFQADCINPDPELVMVRSLAIAGRILCARRDLSVYFRRIRDRFESVSAVTTSAELLKFAQEEFKQRFGVTSDELCAELAGLEATLTRHSATHADIAKSFHLQQALMASRMLRRMFESDFLGRLVNASVQIDADKVLECLRDLEGLFFVLDKKDSASNEIQWQQSLRELEERLEGFLFELRTSADEIKTKDAQFLCWVGLARIHASHSLPRGEAILTYLRACLQAEARTKAGAGGARRLIENIHVRKCIFWINFARCSRQVDTILRKMEEQAGRVPSKVIIPSESQERGSQVGSKLINLVSGGALASAEKKRMEEQNATVSSIVTLRTQMDSLFARLEQNLMDLVFCEPDPNKKVNLADRKINKYLNRGLRLPEATTGVSVQQISGDSLALRGTFAHSAMVSTGGRDELSMGQSSGGLMDDEPLLSGRECKQVERILAKTQAGEILAQLLQVRYQGTKKRSETMRRLTERMDNLELRYSKLICEDETIKFVRGLSKLEDQLAKVNKEWEDLSSKQEMSLGKKAINSHAIQERENCFRLGVSFVPEVPQLAISCTRLLEELSSKSYAGLVLMNVALGKLADAEIWTESLRTKLPSHCIEHYESVAMALNHYRRARLKMQLGTTMYQLFNLISRTRLMVNLLVFWLVFALPLLLGLNFVVHNQWIRSNPKQLDWWGETVFWLRFFGTLFPVLFILFGALRWTLERRMVWFGEKEAEEEMQEEVKLTLIASQIAKKIESRRRLYSNPLDADDSSVAFIPPKFGGEYPLWSIGEHLVTAPGKKRMLRRGFRLKVTRVALLTFLFGLCPLVVIPPVLAIVSGNGVLLRSSPYFYVLIIVIVLFPLCTLVFVAQKLVFDAMPRNIYHARKYIHWYFMQFLAFPLLLGIPLLVFPTPQSDGVAAASVYTWVVISLLGVILAVVRDFVKFYSEFRAWMQRLTWEKEPIHKIATFTFWLSLVFTFLSPIVVFVMLIIIVGSPAAGRLSPESQSAAAFAIAAMEVLACLGCVGMCTAGVKLGYIHPRLAASSVLPGTFIALGGMVATVLAAHVVRRNGNPANVPMDGIQQRASAEGSVWAAGVQILLLLLGIYQFLKDWEKREMFGYFPDDWELIAPTARFVVEEARDVPFQTNDQLRRELIDHGVDIPLDPVIKQMDRARAEQALEDQLRLEKEGVEQFQREMKRKKIHDAKEIRNQLAETVFSEVMHHTSAPNQEVLNAIVKQFRVAKVSLSLSYLLESKRGRRVRFSMSSFRATHFLDLLDQELHVVNILFKVIHAYTFESIQEFKWLTSDTVAGKLPNYGYPELLISMLEMRFTTSSLDTSRLFVFESPEDRDEFISYIWIRTLERVPGQWTYDGDGIIDSIRRVKPDAGITDSANV